MSRASFRWQLAAPAILLPFVLISSWICYRALGARREAEAESAAARRIAATVTVVDSKAPKPGEPIASAADFTDAALYRGRLYLCGPGGLYGYDPEGALVETFRVGRELPPHEPVALSTGRGGAGTALFIATAGGGALEFDGARFRQILPVDPRLRTFTVALGLNSGRMLFGTADRGLLAWDGSALTDFLPELQHAHVTALAGSDADLWIGTLAQGVYRLHAGQLDRLAADLPDPHVLSVALSGVSAYVGTAVGVVEFRNGVKARSLAEGYFAKSLEADDETLAVGTEDEGMITVPLHATPHAGDATAFDLKAPVERIVSLAGARYALAGGLFRAGDTRVLAPQPHLLSDRNIAALAVSHDGRVWTGYFDRGLDIADAGFENVRHFEDDHLFCVNRIVEEPGGARTAVATANGLVLFDASLTARQILGRKDGLLADHVTDVLFRPGGMVIATPAGLSIAGPGGIRSLYVFHGLVNNHVYALAASDGHVAAGTLGGLSLLANDAVEANYTTANSTLKHNWISALARVGNEWFAGTYGAGVMRLDAAGQWHGFPELKDRFEVNPNAMLESAGYVYAGSLGKGLWVYSTASGRWTNFVAGLPSLNVTALAAGDGYIYTGTDNGLVRFHPGDLQ